MDVEERTPVSAATVLSHLEDVEEPNEVQRTTREHLTKHLAVHDPDTFDEMMDEVAAMDGFKDEHVIKIIETLPRSAQEVQALFSKERIKLEDGSVDEIVAFAESVGSR